MVAAALIMFVLDILVAAALHLILDIRISTHLGSKNSALSYVRYLHLI